MEGLDKTQVGRHYPAEDASSDVTVSGKRDRKTDGRFEAGDLIMNRYQVLAELGQGGMGVVYKCFDQTAGIEVALKALPPELSHNTREMEDIKENFQLVAQLVHQNIAISKNLERDNSNGSYYLIMECVKGEDLRYWLKRKRKEGNITLNMILPIIRQVAAALDYAHKQRIIHRDIKPGNIMINGVGEVKVLDFGLAAQIHTSMNRISMVFHGTSGTGPYMSPEQWKGRMQGTSADQYALAVMTYEMLAGHLPFEGSDVLVLREAILNESPDPIANASKHVNTVICRALSKDPAVRFASCTEFVDALEATQPSRPVLNKNNGLKKNVFMAVWSVIFLAVVAGGVTFLFCQNDILAPTPSIDKTEFFRHYTQIEQTVNRIQDINYDRGETFGTHLDQMLLNFNAATTAKNEKEYGVAESCIAKVEAEVRWLETNAPLRQQSRKLKSEIPAVQADADKFQASKYAADNYLQAQQSVQAGEQAIAEGKFEEALQLFQTAQKDFAAAGKSAQDFLVNLHVRNAQKALSGQQWQTVRYEAKAILELDADNAEAQKFLNDAQSGELQEKVDRYLADARQAYNAKHWQEAITAANAALKLAPNNPDAIKMKKNAEAGRSQETALKAEKSKQDAIRRAIAFYEQKDYDNAFQYSLKADTNHAAIQAQLGRLYANGWGVERNYAEAVKWARKAAEQGDAYGEFLLAEFYQNGWGVPIDYTESLKWARKSAEQGNGYGEALLANLYREGYGVTKNYDEAAKWARKSAAQGNSDGECLLGCLYAEGFGVPKDYAEAAKWARKSAEQGNGDGEALLANLYIAGVGVKQDYDEALKWVRKSVRQKNFNGEDLMGDFYQNGWGVVQDYTEAAKWYRKAAAQNHSGGECSLGYLYLIGQGVEKNYQEALKWVSKSAEQKHDRGECLLGIMYENGYGLTEDYEEAYKWYSKAAEQGNADAEYLLGCLYESGNGVLKDYATAAKWYRKAAEQGTLSAIEKLGDFYHFGTGVQPDAAEAVKWYRKAAEQGSAPAAFSLGNMLKDGSGVPKNYQEAVKWARFAAEQKHANGQSLLGYLYMMGYGVKKDYAEALKWGKLAAEQGSSNGECLLGELYSRGLGVPKNILEAIKWYRKAAARNFEYAQERLSEIQNSGEIQETVKAQLANARQAYNGRRWQEVITAVNTVLEFDSENAEAKQLQQNAENKLRMELTSKAIAFYNNKDYNNAFQYSLKADTDNSTIQFQLGWMYASGNGTTQDYSEAVKWYRKSAEQGESSAQLNLGFMYEHGQGGLSADSAEAVKWYRKSAEQGSAIAQNNLGIMYANGRGVEKNDTEAVKWFRKAAEQGYADAQNNLAFMYEHGRGGLSADNAEAVKWYRKAAEQGYAEAQYNLGVMYANGHGVEKDNTEAVKWYRKAAAQGYADAQNNLGVMYENGHGVTQDKKEAVKWYRKAAEQNNANGQFNLGDMYEHGKGVEQNSSEALKWYRKAAEQGHKQAQKALARLE